MNKFIEILKNIKFKIVNGMFFRNKNKLILNKNNNYNNMKIKFSNNFIKTKNTSNIEMMSEKIKNFLIVMNRNCKNFKSDILANNFKKTLFDLSNIKTEELKILEGCVSSVVEDENKVLQIVYKINSFSTCNHELLHLSTLNLLDNGFEQNSSYKPFATGINEGYTQFLAERYFNENSCNSYFFLKYICKILERVIEKDKMEEFYFSASLNLLINELEQYESSENIIKFIKDTDLLNEICINKIKDPTWEEIIKFQCIVNDVCDFLLSCFKSKIDIIIEDDSVENKNSNIELLLSDIFFGSTITTFTKAINIKRCVINWFSDEKITNLFNYAEEKCNLLASNKNR